MILYNTIQNNFTTLLRAGSFNITGTQLQPMSLFKWHRLLLLASQLKLSGIISCGLNILQHDPMLPREIIFEADEGKYDVSQAQMFNYFSQKKYNNIKYEERHSIDTNIETLELLNLLVANANDITTSDININGVISIGKYLRTRGDRVDFVKLSEWIERLGIVQVTSMIGTLLIELFDFDIDELEIIKRPFINSLSHYDRLISSLLEGKKHHFSSLTRMNIAALETMSFYVGQLTSKIRNIEE